MWIDENLLHHRSKFQLENGLGVKRLVMVDEVIIVEFKNYGARHQNISKRG